MSEKISNGVAEYIKLLEDVSKAHGASIVDERQLTLNAVDFQTLRGVASDNDVIDGSADRTTISQKLAEDGYFAVPGGPKESVSVYQHDSESNEIREIDI